MKQIDNYIQEKLYIGKGYNSNETLTKEQFYDYMLNLGLYRTGMRIQFTKEAAYPNIWIFPYDKSFTIHSVSSTDSKKVYVEVKPGKYKILEAEKVGMDMSKNNVFLYTTNNAQKIFDILHEEY